MNLELLAWIRSASLDERLARGAHPEEGRLLAVRSRQLLDVRHRAELADQWLALLTPAPAARQSSRVAVDRAHVAAARDGIVDLASVLRGTPSVRLVARARQLLTDGTGPVYRSQGDLRVALARVLSAPART